ncbi:acyl-coenzyme A thioesterase 1-like [Ptychodera flava]|uniref:acyl-coenzyme A thioesterase 1-like n=1 Tax=Ptychodera flava TaxID=63121 RepID=UPI00396AA0C7
MLKVFYRACKLWDRTGKSTREKQNFVLQSVRNYSKMTPQITVTPRISLADEKLSVAVSHLQPSTPVTIRVLVKTEKNYQFEAHAHYNSTADGRVDVQTQPAISGSYQGIEPMGLLWSMAQSPGQRKGLRFTKTDVTKPSIMEFGVYPNHLDVQQFQEVSPICTTIIERHYMSTNMERIPVKEGRVRGTLFKPKGNGPFPGIIDLYGTAGGLMEMRAALLANHGYTVLALAFAGYDDLPKTFMEIDLDYFEESLNWFSNCNFVKPGGIGTIGLSKGGELAIAMAIYFPDKVKAVVSLNGAHMHTYSSMLFRGKHLPFTNYDASRMIFKDDGSTSCLELVHDPVENSVFKFEDLKAELLLVAAGDDMNWKSVFYAEEAVRRLRALKKTNFKLFVYPAAGHLIEPAYTPFCFASYHSIGSNLMWGGTAKPHADAQQECWKETLEHFHRYLGSQNSTTHSKL